MTELSLNDYVFFSWGTFLLFLLKSEREFSQRSKMLPVTAKILLPVCYANCLCKLSFMYIELPVLKGDSVEEEFDI